MSQKYIITKSDKSLSITNEIPIAIADTREEADRVKLHYYLTDSTNNYNIYIINEDERIDHLEEFPDIVLFKVIYSINHSDDSINIISITPSSQDNHIMCKGGKKDVYFEENSISNKQDEFIMYLYHNTYNIDSLNDLLEKVRKKALSNIINHYNNDEV